MHFTESDFKKIRDWLIKHSIKDSQFPEADPLTGEETIAIVQQGENRNITISELLNIKPTPEPEPDPDPPAPETKLSVSIDCPTLVELDAAGYSSASCDVTVKILNNGEELSEDFTDSKFTVEGVFTYSDGRTRELGATTYNESSKTFTVSGITDNGSLGITVTSVSTKYNGTEQTVSDASATCTFLRPSFIGYFADYNSFSTSAEGLIKILKTNIADTYNVTNSTGGFAHLVVAIPKDSNVAEITSIIQISDAGINVPQNIEEATSSDSLYKLFYTTSKHNSNSYKFKIE